VETPRIRRVAGQIAGPVTDARGTADVLQPHVVSGGLKCNVTSGLPVITGLACRPDHLFVPSAAKYPVLLPPSRENNGPMNGEVCLLWNIDVLDFHHRHVLD
jgi:hypothetical protein